MKVKFIIEKLTFRYNPPLFAFTNLTSEDVEVTLTYKKIPPELKKFRKEIKKK